MKLIARLMIICTLLVLAMPLAQAATNALTNAVVPSAKPTATEVEHYTRPLVRARLRLPDSLHSFVVTTVTPVTSDPSRFAVEVRFRASTPFGAITEHSARFQMKRASSMASWIVTVEP